VRQFLQITAITLACLLSATSVRAGTLAVDFATLIDTSSNNLEMGFQFQLSATRVVDGLGFLEVDNGLQEGHKVGLWTESGTLLASTTVTNASTLIPSATAWIPGWLVQSITPVTLTPGVYRIAALYEHDMDAFAPHVTDLILDPALTILNEAHAVTNGSSTLVFPGDPHYTTYPNGLYGPTLTFAPSTVPEPATFGLLSLAGFAALRRRR
jgi:hypothetical protein